MNRYDPSKASVADPTESSRNSERPPHPVRAAICLFLASLALGSIKVLSLPPAALVLAVVVIVIWLVLFAAMIQRKNWARITFLVLFLVGIPEMYAMKEAVFSGSTASIALFLVQSVAQIAGLVLLFIPVSNKWFRKQSITS